MKRIMVVEPMQLSPEDILKLEANDVIVIQCLNPENVRFMKTTSVSDIEVNNITKAALGAIASASSDVTAKNFVRDLYDSLTKRK